MVGSVPVGGGAPISVQSMCTTSTADTDAILQQIAELTAAGCEIVRVAVPSRDDARALPRIVARSPIPVIADSLGQTHRNGGARVLDTRGLDPVNTGADWIPPNHG
ncbi:hypothetical protein AW168_21775 [Nocardia brasiliensis]|nr:hypothetical protein AW168_21775 [Nocardia brasiliensis]